MKKITRGLILVTIISGCTPEKSPLGAECSVDSDCSTGFCIQEMKPHHGSIQGTPALEFKGGICTEQCLSGWPESPQGTCLEGEICFTWYDGDSTCLLDCLDDKDCADNGRPDFRCADLLNGHGVCLSPLGENK